MLNRKILLENCANSVLSCIIAEQGGADRIELCAGLPEGGTTPSLGTVLEALDRVSIPIFPIVRPRGGDFLYNEIEKAVILADIRLFVEAGVSGVVVGALTAEGRLDRVFCQDMIVAANGCEVTLHRAFDMVRDMDEALEDAVSLGFTRILTSGGRATATEGKDTILHLVEQSRGRISIMPGCGINSDNIAEVVSSTGVSEVHASLRSGVESGMLYRNPLVSMGGSVKIDEYLEERTDEEKIAKAVRILSDLQ